jgi:hypothetical protein
MAADISCPNCHQGFGKDKESPRDMTCDNDKESPRDMTCDNCGEEFHNQYGITPEQQKAWDEEES